MDKGSATEAIALIGFGSSRPYNKEAMLYNINLLKKAGVKNTYYAFIGREGPTVQEMMDTVRKDGIKRLAVIPFLMATGEMSIKYIPDKLGISGRYGEHEVDGMESTRWTAWRSIISDLWARCPRRQRSSTI